ncbi:MAG: hypothetical protein J4F32_06010 [Dehalococcoidia bacterium]|nr:hypothetical protein [Dehalococcoidia bacterium]
MHLSACQPFKLDLGWLQGQAFRWTKREGWFYGIVEGNLIKVRQAEGGIEFHSNASEESLKPLVISYFRLDQDITPTHKALRKAGLGDLVDKYGGTRILRQDPWECLIAYACSRNNNVERITAIVDALATRYGECQTLDGVTCHSFPSAKCLAEVGKEELERLGFGLNRAELISKLAQDVAARELPLDDLTHCSHEEARCRLMKYPGIGQKIAACVCLFSLHMDDAFPVDTHIGNGLKRRFGKEYTPVAKNARLLAWARDKFGAHAGYAGQLLFLEGRHSKGG